MKILYLFWYKNINPKGVFLASLLFIMLIFNDDCVKRIIVFTLIIYNE